jgi:hypothetical protein
MTVNGSRDLLPAIGMLLLGVFVGAGPSHAAATRPPEIVSWRHQILPKERYQALAKDWERYTGLHSTEVRAWVEWGHALRYAGEWETGNERYAKAYAIDSTDVAAIDAWLGPHIGELETASAQRTFQRRLLDAIGRDPGYTRAYYTLWNISEILGDEKTAKWCLEEVVAQGDMPAALFEFGANLVMGAPEGAIVLTNGDNDTYPCVAFQAMTGERPDVSIVNLSLLNLPSYVKRARDRGVPIDLDDDAIAALKHEEGNLIADQVLTGLLETLRKRGNPRPIGYSITVDEGNRRLPGTLTLEGLVLRLEPGQGSSGGKWTMNVGRTRELFDTVYRIDGITDPLVDWERESSVARLGINYAHVLGDLAQNLADAGSPADADRTFYRAAAIFRFHRHEDDRKALVAAWEKAAPRSTLLARARREHEASKR